MSKIVITGNTYPVKEQLKALGGRWDADRKAWMVPADQATEAQALVDAAPKSAPNSGARRTYHRCNECGAPSKGYYRCYTCSIDYRDGGGMAHGGMSYRDRNGNFVLGDND